MVKPRVLILRAPGTNCDVETQFAFEQAGATADRVHVNRLREDSSLINDYQVLCLPGGLGNLDSAGQLALRYTKPDGSSDKPNGSMADVAGCCDTSGRVFGLIPHPERFLDPTNHPNWTRMKDLPSEGDGCALFRNAVQFFS